MINSLGVKPKTSNALGDNGINNSLGTGLKNDTTATTHKKS